MTYLNKNLFINRPAFTSFFAIALAFGFLFTGSVFGQDPTPTPEMVLGGFKVTSSVEVGIRGLKLTGSEDKFRSDLNYRRGIRLFDSSFVIDNEKRDNFFVDTVQVTSSGWAADNSGFARISAEKLGAYRFDSNLREIAYFNNLNNHAFGQHSQNTKHKLGDFDLTIFPQREEFRMTFGYSYNKTTGPGVWTTRAYSDEFPVTANFENSTDDFRIGLMGKIFGFNLGLNQGIRSFNDETSYRLTAPNLGNNPTNNARLATFSRELPVNGKTYYTSFNAQRTFAKRVDFTARIIYSGTDTNSRLIETITGRDNSNNQVDLDRFDISGDAKRVQTRGDFGLTVLATDDFRISNTFSFDKFAINGGEAFLEQFFRRNNAGNPLATVVTRSTAYRVTDFERFMNLIEADYQFNNSVGFHIGYRITKRRVDISGYDLTITSAPSPTNPANILEESDNTTNTVIAGMKIKPMKNWAIFWDAEHGSADNVFTRIANYRFTNLRVRSRWSFDKVSLNLSAITKDNSNPAQSIEVPPRDFGADVNNRIYSGSLDWTPNAKVNINTGYTYQHLTSESRIIVPVSGQRLEGFSQYFIRDHSVFFDVFAKPTNRVSFFASYRMNKDNGQGDVLSLLAQNIISSYPIQFQSPEVKMSIRINNNIDWNVGYQYYDYKERFQNVQNYRAHLPYTSLRIS